MDTIKAIFAQLGVDSSLLPQFVILVFIFLIAKFLFLNHLQFVLENREEKTVKLESSADEALDKVNKLAADYKSKIDEAHRESMKVLSAKKAEISNKYNDEFRKVEREVSSFVEESRRNFEKEIDANRSKYLAEVDTLAGQLVNKIVN